MNNSVKLPQLIYKGNEQKKMTLHLFLQIIGKIRLKSTPRKNHWWYVTEYVSTKGITSGAVPYNNGLDTFDILINVNEHLLEVSTSKGEFGSFSLLGGISVADFYTKLFEILERFNISIAIIDKPYDLNIDQTFGEITDYHHYDAAYTQDFWRTMLWVDGVFKEFSGRFYGKTCPVHLYWHSMDLAVTRFSGRRAPAMAKDARLSDKDAYTHECISFGFWGGDENMQEPAFYSYTYPAPEGLDKEPLQPSAAQWVESNGSPMAILTYNNLLKSADPYATLLDFMESAYTAGAKRANWDIEALNVPKLENI
ncbi:hypothetical protein SAMN05661096_00082 [Marivirga sericea]|uniref:Ava_C0101 and related proteins n=1 Tax=Marivirga sericea TaxID=1028 RepID=A0A1X7I2F6_9BACT|nr:DUF5996 family protein [Marivirga sericea]SMG07851.1 hypothetical protein SAMN05661096_00082 [Marivirga sericea]